MAPLNARSVKVSKKEDLAVAMSNKLLFKWRRLTD